jgi:hypothetical protein
MPRRGKIRPRGTGTPSFTVDSHFAPRKTLRSLSVDVVGRRITCPPRTFHERLVKKLRGVDWNDVQRATRTMIEVLATPARFGALEVRQDIRVTPTIATQVAPLIEVTRVTPHVEHAVDRRTAAENPSPRNPQRPTSECCLRLAHESPGEARIHHRAQESQRHTDCQVSVAPAGLEQQDRRSSVFRQATGYDTARGTRADHDVVDHAGR